MFCRTLTNKKYIENIMWWFIKIVVFSTILIALLHYGWEYIKSTYSTSKIKDIIKTHTDKYESMLSELIENKQQTSNTNNDFDMENDLAKFLEESIARTAE
jgi:uncharacterized protein YeeX (DUF496 family)